MPASPAPTIPADDPLAVEVVTAIRAGDVARLSQLLEDNPRLARAQIADPRCDDTRSLLHISTDWPGHFPNAAQIVRTLIAAGADVHARFGGGHTETPLHWAASSDDVGALDALIDAGADIEAHGAVIADGTPIADAVAFGQWNAARRLVERGARTTLWQAAALGLIARVEQHFTGAAPPAPDEVTNAFWCACHGGQRTAAEYLLDQGADIDWIGYDQLTALDAARRSGAHELADWLRERGARSAADLS
jgi:uncharacterized protein